VKPDEMRKAPHEPGTSRPPEPAQPAPRARDRAATETRAGTTPAAAPAPPPAATSVATKKPAAEKKASSKGSPKIKLEWEDQEPEWSFNNLEVKDEDFFTLVTEDLYLREFGRQEEDEFGGQLELLSFRLASETYAVRLTNIKQIIKMVPITMVPRAPSHVLGVISLRGTIIPIFDLRRILHLSAATASRKTRIIILAEGKYSVGLIVDEVKQVVRLPASKIEPPPSVLAGVEGEYIQGIGRAGNIMLILLALDKIMVPAVPGKAGAENGAGSWR